MPQPPTETTVTSPSGSTDPHPPAPVPPANVPEPPTDPGRPARWYRSKAPAHPGPGAVAFATVTSLAGLALLAGVGVALGQTLLLPPLAASMSLVAGAAATPLGQPRNVIGGQLASALTGFLVLYVGGRGVWSAVVAGGLALGVMLALRVSHSPAVATAVIVTVSGPPFGAFMALLALACVLLVGVGLLANRAGRRNYPLYWW